MMQQRAAGGVLQQEVRPLLVELHQLHEDRQTHGRRRTASETFEGFGGSGSRAESLQAGAETEGHSLGSGLQS